MNFHSIVFLCRILSTRKPFHYLENLLFFVEAARDDEQRVLADSVKRAKDAFDKAGKNGKDQLSLEAASSILLPS